VLAPHRPERINVRTRSATYGWLAQMIHYDSLQEYVSLSGQIQISCDGPFRRNGGGVRLLGGKEATGVLSVIGRSCCWIWCVLRRHQGLDSCVMFVITISQARIHSSVTQTAQLVGEETEGVKLWRIPFAENDTARVRLLVAEPSSRPKRTKVHTPQDFSFVFTPTYWEVPFQPWI
jgi:hypothetical protein